MEGEEEEATEGEGRRQWKGRGGGNGRGGKEATEGEGRRQRKGRRRKEEAMKRRGAGEGQSTLDVSMALCNPCLPPPPYTHRPYPPPLAHNKQCAILTA